MASPSFSRRDAAVYAAFFFVGAGCGWFPCDAIFNLVLNEPSIPTGVWFGRLLLIGGIVGICDGLLYLLYLCLCPGRMPLRVEQTVIAGMILANVANLTLLAGFWPAGAPRYPVVVAGDVFGNLVVHGTYYLVIPLIATSYGGWLVAPLRTGTDFTSLATALLGEAQNPSGSRNLFPSWVVLLCFAAFACVGLFAWLAIVRFDVGLESERERSTETETVEGSGNFDVEAPMPVRKVSLIRRLATQLRCTFACPRSLLSPVLVGTLADILQWGLIAAVSDIGAAMTDPAGCAGARGRWVARTSFTANRMLVPLGSLLSTPLPCSRPLFSWLGGAPPVVAALCLLAVFGVGRDLWTTAAGQLAYIACYGVLGGLEGYLFTMAYRFIGDAEGLPLKQRRSTSSLLSLLNIVLMSVISMGSGQLVNSGAIRCVDP